MTLPPTTPESFPLWEHIWRQGVKQLHVWRLIFQSSRHAPPKKQESKATWEPVSL